LLCQLAHFFFKLFVLAAPIRKRAAQPGVKFVRLRSLRNQTNIFDFDSCARDNDDLFPRGFDEFGENDGSLERALRAARRQNSLCARPNYIFER